MTISSWTVIKQLLESFDILSTFLASIAPTARGQKFSFVKREAKNSFCFIFAFDLHLCSFVKPETKDSFVILA